MNGRVINLTSKCLDSNKYKTKKQEMTSWKWSDLLWQIDNFYSWLKKSNNVNLKVWNSAKVSIIFAKIEINIEKRC